MTTVQSMMLSVCFGAVIGGLIANMVFIVKCAVSDYKEKKHKCKKKRVC